MVSREAGNALYKARRFGEALEAYDQAVAGGDALAEGNRAAVLLELGRYSESCAAAVAAAAAAEAEGDGPRASRMHSRAARAAFLQSSWRQAAQEAALGGPGSRGLLHAAEARAKLGPEEEEGGLMATAAVMSAREAREARFLMRPSPTTGECLEFYAWGHGAPDSLLLGPRRMQGSELWGFQDDGGFSHEAFREADARREDLGVDVEALLSSGKPAKFFLGGVGDGRHAMATIRGFAELPAVRRRLLDDGDERMSAPGHPQEPVEAAPPGLHLTLNDIKVEALARDIIVFRLLHQLGKHSPDHFQLGTSINWADVGSREEAWKGVEEAHARAESDPAFSEALEDLALACHAFASPLLLPPHYRRLQGLAAELSKAEKPPDAWIKADEQCWEALRGVFRFWASGVFDGRLVDGLVEDYSTVPSDARQAEMVEDMQKQRVEAMRADMETVDDDKAEEMLQMMPDLLQMAEEEGLTSREERTAFLKEEMMNMFDEMAENPDLVASEQSQFVMALYSAVEQEVAKRFKFLMPPIELWRRYRGVLRHSLPPRQRWEGDEKDDDGEEDEGSVRPSAAVEAEVGWSIEAQLADARAWLEAPGGDEGSSSGGGRRGRSGRRGSGKSGRGGRGGRLLEGLMGNFTVVARDHVDGGDDGDASPLSPSSSGGGGGGLRPKALGMRLQNHILGMLSDFACLQQSPRDETEQRDGQEGGCGGPSGLVFRARCLCDHLSPFLVGTGRALRQLADSGMLLLTIAPGDMHKAAVREERGTFSGIHLSNVPDYTGLINTFAAMKPLLRAEASSTSSSDGDDGAAAASALAPWSSKLGPGDRLPAFIRHEILLNTGMFSNLQHAFQTWLHLPDMTAPAAALGMAFAGGSLWGALTYWQPCVPLLKTHPGALLLLGGGGSEGRQGGPGVRPPPGTPQDEASMHSWLMRLLLAVAMPAVRNSESICREDAPLTMAAWFGVLGLLLDAGFPRHWLARLVEDIDANRVTTSERRPHGSPCDWRPSGSSSGPLDLSALLPDFRAAASLFPELSFCLSKSFSGSSATRWFEWGCPFRSEEDGMMQGLLMSFPGMAAKGLPSSSVVGLVTVPGDPDCTLQQRVYVAQHILNMLEKKGAFVGENPGALAGSGVTLHTMVRWDSKAERLMVLLADEDRHRMSAAECIGFLIRTDNWAVLPAMGAFPLAWSQPVPRDGSPALPPKKQSR